MVCGCVWFYACVCLLYLLLVLVVVVAVCLFVVFCCMLRLSYPTQSQATHKHLNIPTNTNKQTDQQPHQQANKASNSKIPLWSCESGMSSSTSYNHGVGRASNTSCGHIWLLVVIIIIFVKCECHTGVWETVLECSATKEPQSHAFLSTWRRLDGVTVWVLCEVVSFRLPDTCCQIRPWCRSSSV